MTFRVLVTGGAGYIGRYVMAAAESAGCQAIWVDRAMRVDRLPGDYDGALVDLLDPVALSNVIADVRPHGIIHLAAHSDVAESVRDPGKYAENVAMCRILAKVAVRLPIVLASSAAVYGERYHDEVDLVDEHDMQAPVSPYGWSKLASEAALPNAMALRLFNVAGGQGDAGDHIIPRAVDAYAGRRSLRINGRGNAVRDFVHVQDVAEAFVAAVLALSVGARAQPLNICTGEARSVRDVVNALGDRSLGGLPVTYGPERPGDVARLVGDNTAARRELGWTPQRDFEAIVVSALAGVRAADHMNLAVG